MKPVIVVVCAIAGAVALARNTKGSPSGAIKPNKTKVVLDPAPTSFVKNDALPFVRVKSVGVDLDEKNRIDVWLFAALDEVNMFGDALGTKYEHDTPLSNGSGGVKNNKYEYILMRNPDRPWNKVRRFPKHWGKKPDAETRDYVKLPEDYGFGSSTLRKWIEENIARDEETKLKAEEEAGSRTASPMTSPMASPSPAD